MIDLSHRYASEHHQNLFRHRLLWLWFFLLIYFAYRFFTFTTLVPTFLIDYSTVCRISKLISSFLLSVVLLIFCSVSRSTRVATRQLLRAHYVLSYHIAWRPLTGRVFGDPLNVAIKTVNVEMFAIELRALALSEVCWARWTILQHNDTPARHVLIIHI